MKCTQCGSVEEGGGPVCGDPGTPHIISSGGGKGTAGPKRKRTSRPTGNAGILIAAAVVLVLVFTMFSGCNGGGNVEPGDTSGPAAAVDAFFQAIVEGDVDALIAAIDPVYSLCTVPSASWTLAITPFSG